MSAKLHDVGQILMSLSIDLHLTQVIAFLTCLLQYSSEQLAQSLARHTLMDGSLLFGKHQSYPSQFVNDLCTPQEMTAQNL